MSEPPLVGAGCARCYSLGFTCVVQAALGDCRRVPVSVAFCRMSGPVKLSSWKAIAAHMGRDVRTVQRWEAAEGLPVHRLEHRRRGSVYAFADELDAWITARSVGPVAPAAEEGDAGAPVAAARKRPEPSGHPLIEVTTPSDPRERPESGGEYPPAVVAGTGRKLGRAVLAASLMLVLAAGVWLWVWPRRTAQRQVEVPHVTLPALPVPRRW